MKKLFTALLACFAIGAMAQENLILHYDFVGDEGTTVSDKSNSHHDGTLKGSASVADGTDGSSSVPGRLLSWRTATS